MIKSSLKTSPKTSIEINILASGSRGNCALIQSGSTAVLLDAGISARRITAGLKALHMDISDVNAILLTHEHTDHVRGLKTLLKKNSILLFSRAETFKALPDIEYIPQQLCQVIESEAFTVGNFVIKPFSISHDAADPVGFRFENGSFSVTSATDLGFVSRQVHEAMEDSDALILEANHDIAMLQNGAYPWPLKQRILGKCGHLSNFTAGMAIAQLQKKPQNIILAHLSEKNNTPLLAQNTICNMMKRQKAGDIPLYTALPDEIISIKV